MEGRQPKDVAALFERAGLGKTGNYREFSNGRPAPRSVETSPTATGSTQEAPVIETSQLVPAPVPVHAPEPLVPESVGPALDRLFAGNANRQLPSSPEPQCSAIALFSLAGGVGKTTLATNIGRILSGHGLRVVLANWGRAFAFQHLMNSRAQTVGSLSFIHPPNSENAPPMILIECGELAAGGEGSEALRLVEQASGHADVTLLDLPVSLGATTYGLLLQSDHVIVPLLPDVQSVATLQLLEEVLVTQGSPGPEAHYVINRYQASRSLHRETFDRLRDKLGDQLMPNYVRESPEIQDAMWSGVTVVDHAPTSTVAVDLHALAGSVRQLTPRRSVRKGSIA